MTKPLVTFYMISDQNSYQFFYGGSTMIIEALRSITNYKFILIKAKIKYGHLL